MGKHTFPLLPSLFLAVILSMCFISSGCGGKGPISSSPSEQFTQTYESSGRVLWGVWEIDLREIGEADINFLRGADIHVNVIDYLLPPACNDCLKVQVTGVFPSENRLEIDITLKNPTSLQGYDVRGILLSDDGHNIYNADDYTELWDNGGWKKRNPFKRYPADPGPYIFLAGASETNHYSVQVPDPMMLDKIEMAVDASWPGPCKEPFNIGDTSKEIWGNLSEDGGTLNFFVDVLTHGADIESVFLEMNSIGVGELELSKWDAIPSLSNFYSAFNIPFAGVEPGEYNLWVRAKTTDSPILLLDRLRIEIFPNGKIIPKPIVFDRYATTFSDSALAASNGNLYAIGSSGLKSYSLSSSGSPTLIGFASGPPHVTDRYYLYVRDTLAFAYFERWEFLESTLAVYDVSDSENIELRGTIESIPIFGDCLIKDNYLICSVPAWNRVVTIDASDPDDPFFAGDYIFNDIPWGLHMDGTDLFVILEGKGVKVLNYSNPLLPFPKGTFIHSEVTNMALALSYPHGFVWDSTGELTIFNYENAGIPTIVSSTQFNPDWNGDTFTGFKLDGDFLYAWGDTVYVFDVSDVMAPELIFEPTIAEIAPTTSSGLTFYDRFAYSPIDKEIELIWVY